MTFPSKRQIIQMKSTFNETLRQPHLHNTHYYAYLRLLIRICVQINLTVECETNIEKKNKSERIEWKSRNVARSKRWKSDFINYFTI